ncbi:MAG: hypothetical protein M3N82_00400 [Pseudomonadota bacterium]|nr:hypothetical protein [Pseudomonadota bacterium]
MTRARWVVMPQLDLDGEIEAWEAYERNANGATARFVDAFYIRADALQWIERIERNGERVDLEPGCDL